MRWCWALILALGALELTAAEAGGEPAADDGEAAEIAAAIERAEREPAPELDAAARRRAEAAADQLLAEIEGEPDPPLPEAEAAQLDVIERDLRASLALLEVDESVRAAERFVIAHKALAELDQGLRERAPRRIAELEVLHLEASRGLAEEDVLRLPDDDEAAAPDTGAAERGL